MSQHVSSSTHLEMTSNSDKEEVTSVAVVAEIRSLSPTVKHFRLKVSNDRVVFTPGQWVDVRVPGVSEITGYSMCSSPLQLREEGILDLAVKYSDHPPTEWMHEKCSVSDQLLIRVGGDFAYAPAPGQTTPPLLLLAAGVGINPFLSMIRHHLDLWRNGNWNRAESSIPKLCLLYSAKQGSELLFKDEIDSLLEGHSEEMRAKYFVTQEELLPSASGHTQKGRISPKDVEEALQFVGGPQSPVSCFLCGPSPFIDSLSAQLSEAGIAEHQVHFEKWWK